MDDPGCRIVGRIRMLLVLKQPRHDEIDRRKIMIPRRGIGKGCLKKADPDSPVIVPGLTPSAFNPAPTLYVRSRQKILLGVGGYGQVVT
jgi:hypothetical protein